MDQTMGLFWSQSLKVHPGSALPPALPWRQQLGAREATEESTGWLESTGAPPNTYVRGSVHSSWSLDSGFPQSTVLGAVSGRGLLCCDHCLSAPPTLHVLQVTRPKACDPPSILSSLTFKLLPHPVSFTSRASLEVPTVTALVQAIAGFHLGYFSHPSWPSLPTCPHPVARALFPDPHENFSRALYCESPVSLQSLHPTCLSTKPKWKPQDST